MKKRGLIVAGILSFSAILTFVFNNKPYQEVERKPASITPKVWLSANKNNPDESYSLLKVYLEEYSGYSVHFISEKIKDGDIVGFLKNEVNSGDTILINQFSYLAGLLENDFRDNEETSRELKEIKETIENKDIAFFYDYESLTLNNQVKKHITLSAIPLVSYLNMTILSSSPEISDLFLSIKKEKNLGFTVQTIPYHLKVISFKPQEEDNNQRLSKTIKQLDAKKIKLFYIDQGNTESFKKAISFLDEMNKHKRYDSFQLIIAVQSSSSKLSYERIIKERFSSLDILLLNAEKEKILASMIPNTDAVVSFSSDLLKLAKVHGAKTHTLSWYSEDDVFQSNMKNFINGLFLKQNKESLQKLSDAGNHAIDSWGRLLTRDNFKINFRELSSIKEKSE